MSGGENDDSGSAIDLMTARGRDWPSVRQFNVFVENRVGGLLDVVRRFETTDIRIVSLSVVDSADCAIVRMVLSDPERAKEIFKRPSCRSPKATCWWCSCPTANPLLQICKALLAAEINIDYAYPLLVGPQGSAAVALTSRTTRRR